MRAIIFSMAFASITFAASLSAQEHKIERSALPPQVLKAVDLHTQGSTIKGFSTEREAGKKVYEVETILNGHTRDLQIAEDGTLNEVEDEIAFSSLPPKVQQALTAKAGGAKITKVESLTKHDKLVAYEAATLKDAHKGEIQVGQAGEMLSHPQ